MATLEYACEGLVGVLTPQANTTVEPEFNILWPAGVAMINARLTSPKQSMAERLADYAGQIETTLDQFANAPIGAAAFACTGASYLIGKDREAALCAKIEKARHYPLVTAARAVCEWLSLLQAKHIGLVSPYPPDLTGQSAAYWQGAGFEVAEVVSVFNEASEFHPIYSLSAGDAGDGLDALADKNLDAIVMLGTNDLRNRNAAPHTGAQPLAWAADYVLYAEPRLAHVIGCSGAAAECRKCHGLEPRRGLGPKNEISRLNLTSRCCRRPYRRRRG